MAPTCNCWCSTSPPPTTMMTAMAKPVRMSTVGVMIWAIRDDSIWAVMLSRAFSS